jgi:peptidylprolyl isomerase
MENLMRFWKKVFSLLLLGLVLLMAAACSSRESAPDDLVSTGGEEPVRPADPARLPRADRVSAADIGKNDAIDFCDEYPEPVTEPFAPEEDNPLFVQDGEPVKGPEEAEITLIWYTDLQCPDCAQLYTVLGELMEVYSEPLRLVLRHFPQTQVYDKSQLAAEATLSVQAQGGDEAFWDFVDLLYSNQAEWSSLSNEDFRAVLADYADSLGLDSDALLDDLEAGTYTEAVTTGITEAQGIGVPVAPTLFINDRIIPQPPPDPGVLAPLLWDAMLKLTYDEYPPMVIDPDKDYSAWIITRQGEIVIDLYANLAPETVNNFAYLACSGYYNDTTFHRVVEGFVAQGGDPTGTGMGGPGYTIPDEFVKSDLTFDDKGLLSMAHTNQPNSAGSQFFITLGPAEHLNGSFTIFGEVVEGMEIVEQIPPRDPQTATTPGELVVSILVREVE